MSDWQPIETAPQDGTTQIWAYNGEQQRMQWAEGEDYALWIYSEEIMSDICPDPDQPTHWMPLPSPPAAQETTHE